MICAVSACLAFRIGWKSAPYRRIASSVTPNVFSLSLMSFEL